MKISEFNSLSDRKKWENYRKLKNVEFACKSCGEIVENGVTSAFFPGSSIHCGNCDEELTHRTRGGQSDPFNWVAIKKTNIINTIERKEYN
jgi:DNA replicative helicase MCM subunit Mcm2 (Cdc46/Mcm family)